MMKAAIWTGYGGPEVLKILEVKEPIPRNREVLVKVISSAVTTGDCRMRRFDVPSGLWFPTRLALGIFKPRRNITGMDFSGEVVAVGGDVTLFEKGDRVFGTTGMALGANAEYICIAEDKAIVKIPDSISHTDSVSLIFGGIAALHFLKGHISQKSKVLINGASGSVGSAATQILKNYGAEITGVCSSDNKELVLSIGADEVIDYTRDDFTNNDIVYDIILDTVGNLSYLSCQSVLSESGKLILINAGLGTILSSLINKRLFCGVAVESKELLKEILVLFESNSLKPIVDRVYPLREIALAHAYVDLGHKKGNVVLTHEEDKI